MNGRKVVLLIGIFGAFLVAVLYLGSGPGDLAVLAIGAAVSTWRNRRRRKDDEAFWSIVWQLRQANTADRARMLADLEPAKLRERIAGILERDGTNEVAGDVEQFPFPRGLQRLATRAYWILWTFALAMILIAAFVPAPLWIRCLPLMAAACCGYGAWSAARRERSYDSIIEVTPFRVTELFPDGRMRTVLLNSYLELHHEPKLKRLRLTPNSREPGIVLDFRRMGFDRMLDLVIRYGQFRIHPEVNERG